MGDEFSAAQVTVRVLEHLERRRHDIARDPAQVSVECKNALAPVRAAYLESQRPIAYYDALEKEISETLPGAWRKVAAPYTEREKRAFDLWRGGDPIARITYVFVGLTIGGLCVELPFIPIWEKWFPFLLAGAAFWLPSLQVSWHRRGYARALGQIVLQATQSQARLDGSIRTEDLLLPDQGEPRG